MVGWGLPHGAWPISLLWVRACGQVPLLRPLFCLSKLWHVTLAQWSCSTFGAVAQSWLLALAALSGLELCRPAHHLNQCCFTVTKCLRCLANTDVWKAQTCKDRRLARTDVSQAQTSRLTSTDVSQGQTSHKHRRFASADVKQEQTCRKRRRLASIDVSQKVSQTQTSRKDKLLASTDVSQARDLKRFAGNERNLRDLKGFRGMSRD